MRIGIIGAGFTGLAAANQLLKKGHKIEVFESAAVPGGLAAGFRQKGWKWPLEKHYHHIFESDRAIINFASELKHKITFIVATTSTLTSKGIYPLDTPISLLHFPGLSLLDKIRVGICIGFLRLTPVWKPLERVKAERYLKDWMGDRAWKALWQSLFEKKFGRFHKGVPASWFWARIKKRSKKLGYPIGGFTGLADKATKHIKRFGGEFHFNTSINRISRKYGIIYLRTNEGKEYVFDKVICTLPSVLFANITPTLPSDYVKSLGRLKGIGAVTLVLTLKKHLLKDVYWLNIGLEDFPFLALVEHTNLISPAHYKGERVAYVGNYLEAGHPFFKLSAKELMEEFSPYLVKINPDFRKSWIKKAEVFKTNFAQPIVTLNYSKRIPPLKTPIEGLYLANIQQVYPWDRGTNYAVELGEKVAELIG